ncbi:MAG TPA: PD-(D/E)XK nuclease family protein [Mucilaginibacter sp.]|jgi:hypothetical protein
MTEDLLQQFVITENLNLERIKLQLHEFNPFDVLGIQHFEIRHSNFLAWMFDPAGSHRLGDYFLKGFITHLENIKPAQKINMFLTDLKGTRVYREWNSIDILIINDELRFVIPIENKVWAGKGIKEQLVRYAKLISHLYTNGEEDDYSIYPVYLTPFNRHLTEEEVTHKYQNVLYKSIIGLLRKTITDVEPEKPVTDFINYYIDNVTKRIMNDDKAELNKLAHRIYREHKEAIDFIISKKPVIYSEANCKVIGKWLSDHPGYRFLPSHDYIVRFLPKSVADLFVNKEFHSWGFPEMFCIELFLNETTLVVKFCAGAVNNESAYNDLQIIKECYFDAMRQFQSIKTIVKRSRATSQYPAVAETTILTTEERSFYESATFLDAFVSAFAKFEELYLSKWTAEVLAKKDKLFPPVSI